MEKHLPLTVVILTYNEEKNIKNCINSIINWCDQIFIVDSGSTDNTLMICEKYPINIISHSYIDHTNQWKWILNNLTFRYEWIMPLDADHIVTDLLKSEIEDILNNPSPNINGYYSKHYYYFKGTRIHGFKPYSLRLFKKSKVKMDDSELVDFRFIIEGKTDKLNGIIIENNQNENSIDFWIDKHQKFSSRFAIEEVLRRSGILNWSLTPQLFGNPDERIIWIKNYWYHMPLFIRPFLYFLYRYIFRCGFLDGINGFIYHFLHAFWFRFIVDIKISELQEKIKYGEINIYQLKDQYLSK